MGRRSYEDDDGTDPEKVQPTPVEPNGFALTKLQKQLKDTKEKMQGVADEITRLLQQEQQRQAKYKGDSNAAGD